MKQLTQAVFDNAPDWVKSAAVDRNGEVWGHSQNATSLIRGATGFTDNSYSINFHYLGDNYDTTNWQNSAIDREFAE